MTAFDPFVVLWKHRKREKLLVASSTLALASLHTRLYPEKGLCWNELGMRQVRHELGQPYHLCLLQTRLWHHAHRVSDLLAAVVAKKHAVAPLSASSLHNHRGSMCAQLVVIL